MRKRARKIVLLSQKLQLFLVLYTHKFIFKFYKFTLTISIVIIILIIIIIINIVLDKLGKWNYREMSSFHCYSYTLIFCSEYLEISTAWNKSLHSLFRYLRNFSIFANFSAICSTLLSHERSIQMTSADVGRGSERASSSGSHFYSQRS